jgi:hypothetical protein
VTKAVSIANAITATGIAPEPTLFFRFIFLMGYDLFKRSDRNFRLREFLARLVHHLWLNRIQSDPSRCSRRSGRPLLGQGEAKSTAARVTQKSLL